MLFKCTYLLFIIAIASNLTLLIGYYHGVLLKDVNADLLFEDMCLKGLLNADQQSLVSSGHSVHYRNWLLLEYIRCMEADCFLMFCELVHNLWPEVGSQLIYGMYILTYNHECSAVQLKVNLTPAGNILVQRKNKSIPYQIHVNNDKNNKN